MTYTLILGAGGFIGTNLIKEYVKNNKKIIVFDRLNDVKVKYFNEVDSEIVKISGSLKDEKLIESVFNQYNINEVIHLISSLKPASGLNDFEKEYSDVIIPTLHLINSMKKFKVRKLIYISSGGTVYGNYKNNGLYYESDLCKPINYYGLSKFIMENLIEFESRKGNLDFLILRPSNPYGRNQNPDNKQGLITVILSNYIENKSIEIWGDGNIIRDYIPVENLVSYIYKLSTANIKNEIFNIGSGKGYSINEIINIIENILDIKLKVNYRDKRSIDANSVVLEVEKLHDAVDQEVMSMDKTIHDLYLFLKDEHNEK